MKLLAGGLVKLGGGPPEKKAKKGWAMPKYPCRMGWATRKIYFAFDQE